jgi:hypothetical protein
MKHRVSEPVAPTATAIAASPAAAAAVAASQSIAVKRLRFADTVPDSAIVRREFRQPHVAAAVEESMSPGELPREPTWPEPTDQLIVVLVSKPAAAEWQKIGEGWLARPDQPEAVLSASVECDGVTIQWRPGRAVVQGRADRFEHALAALADFAFYEGELRKLEALLESRELDAQLDAARAHRINFANRQYWDRFGEMIERLANMRLTYARLEPKLYKGSRTLPLPARRLMTRLLARADVEDRLEALSDRLEACEDLYEGANDRVADFRGYFRGHLLEIAIIVFLLMEVVIMGSELALHIVEYFE